MDRKSIDQFIIMLLSLACLGLIVESMVLGWEFWVPPILVAGVIALWVMHISDTPDIDVREICCFLYAMFVALFHGVHETSAFDIVAVFSLVFVIFSFMNRINMMNLLLIEYLSIFIFQLISAIGTESLVMDALILSRIALHFIVVLSIYIACVKIISVRREFLEDQANKDAQVEASAKDMDDFLSNISHELRTPVNVVNGMSDLMMKKGVGEEAYAVKEAGLRLTGQIDDIQDYTETRRNEVFVEEENYMSTSLINDVVTAFRMNRDNKELELVVDMTADVPTMMYGDVKKLHKIFRHLLSNAIKFTEKGGVLVKMYPELRGYGVNLCLEIIDTGCGMSRAEIAVAGRGLYQSNKKRNRSSGGVGLGLSIVYGFAHSMGGFVKITSTKGNGTSVRVNIPQKVISPQPCFKLDGPLEGDVIFHVRSDKYKVPKRREFYRTMAANLASDIHVPLYPAESLREVEKLIEKLNVSYIFMGEEEYMENAAYFDGLSREGYVVTVSASDGFKVNPGSDIIVMPKPLYAYPVIKVLNEGKNVTSLDIIEEMEKPDLHGIRALVVDDEPMNLVVAVGLFNDYGIITDTANSGFEAIEKYTNEEYDIIFMDHMMPKMDGVEAMKRIRSRGEETGRSVMVVALTANVVSGAREMFIKEGVDAFIGKPINTGEFERVMARLLSGIKAARGGDAA